VLPPYKKPMRWGSIRAFIYSYRFKAWMTKASILKRKITAFTFMKCQGVNIGSKCALDFVRAAKRPTLLSGLFRPKSDSQFSSKRFSKRSWLFPRCTAYQNDRRTVNFWWNFSIFLSFEYCGTNKNLTVNHHTQPAKGEITGHQNKINPPFKKDTKYSSFKKEDLGVFSLDVNDLRVRFTEFSSIIALLV